MSKKLNLGLIILDVVILSVLLTVIYVSAVGYFDSNPSFLRTLKLDSDLVIDVQTNTSIVLNDQTLSYKQGFIKLLAVYCGYGSDLEYAILQTDSVAHPQKINEKANLTIDGDEFNLKDVYCEDISNRYIILEKL